MTDLKERMARGGVVACAISLPSRNDGLLRL